MNTVAVLNAAFKADPNAIHALMCNRVPCNQLLADDPFVQIAESPVLPAGNFQVGAVDLINAVLAANGLPLIALMFQPKEGNEERAKFIGFCEYTDEKCPEVQWK